MEKEYYYVYCKGVLGVKTNFHDFAWVYGSSAPVASSEEYDQCVVKFNVYIKLEKHLSRQYVCDRRFQSYSWDSKQQTLFYDRQFFKKIGIGYRLQMDGNVVNAEIGANYARLVKNRVMNMHGIYYLLSDLANVLLLKNGFLTLYASSVQMEALQRCTVNFAPPNTGKTCMATLLCERYGGTLVGEDIVIFDGEKVHACPWTNSYRKAENSVLDSSGSMRREKRNSENISEDACKITDLTVLSLGNRKIDIDTSRILKDISILNGYLFHYYSTPIVKGLIYFDERYDRPWSVYAEDFLKKMTTNCCCYQLQSEESVDFAEIFYKMISDKEI